MKAALRLSACMQCCTQPLCWPVVPSAPSPSSAMHLAVCTLIAPCMLRRLTCSMATPLHFAAAAKKYPLQSCRVLLAAGADPDMPDAGKCAQAPAYPIPVCWGGYITRHGVHFQRHGSATPPSSTALPHPNFWDARTALLLCGAAGGWGSECCPWHHRTTIQTQRITEK